MATWYLELNDFDKKCAKWYAQELHNYAVSFDLNEKKMNHGKDGLEIHIEGAAAEWAFAKMFNLFPNTQIDGPNHVDFTLPNGMTVDVKSTDNFSGNLLVPLHITSDNSADAFVLMRGTLEKGFEYVGWITREGYYEKATKRQMADDMPYTWYLGAGHLKHEPIIKP